MRSAEAGFQGRFMSDRVRVAMMNEAKESHSARLGPQQERGIEARGPMDQQVFFYRAYGLSIRSELRLPELAPGTGSAFDVSLRLRSVAQPQLQAGSATAFEFQPSVQLLHWRSVGSFLIRDAREIDIDPAPGIDEDLLRLPLLGPVMALLLHQRGMLVLHASAVAMGARSAVFLGDKQAGKSTAAAALVARGHRLLTDDVLAIDFPAAGPRIMPGFPHMKLDPESAERFLREVAVASPTAIPGTNKRRLQFTAPFSQSDVAPGCFYVLNRGPAARISVLSPHDAFVALVRFSYVGRFGSGAVTPSTAAVHLRQCAALVRASRICTLELPHDLDRLGEALRLIEGELE
jgi:hypothetical protein